MICNSVIPANARGWFMQVLVFVTDDGKATEATGPTLVVANAPSAVLPPHPRSLDWRYFATMGSDDRLFGHERKKLMRALKSGQPFITPRLVKC
jgi:hypothetical protein